MNYRLLLFRFIYIDNRYLFPIILNYDDWQKAQVEVDLINTIILKLKEIPGIDNISKQVDKIDKLTALQKEFNAIMGELDWKNIKTIDIEHRRAIALSEDDVNNDVFLKFECTNAHLPIRRLDNFNNININPFIIIEE